MTKSRWVTMWAVIGVICATVFFVTKSRHEETLASLLSIREYLYTLTYKR